MLQHINIKIRVYCASWGLCYKFVNTSPFVAQLYYISYWFYGSSEGSTNASENGKGKNRSNKINVAAHDLNTNIICGYWQLCEAS